MLPPGALSRRPNLTSVMRPILSCGPCPLSARLAYGSLHEASTALFPSGCPLCRRHLNRRREQAGWRKCNDAVAVPALVAPLPQCDVCELSARVVMRGVGLMEREKDYNNAFHYLEILLQVSAGLSVAPSRFVVEDPGFGFLAARIFFQKIIVVGCSGFLDGFSCLTRISMRFPPPLCYFAAPPIPPSPLAFSPRSTCHSRGGARELVVAGDFRRTNTLVPVPLPHNQPLFPPFFPPQTSEQATSLRLSVRRPQYWLRLVTDLGHKKRAMEALQACERALAEACPTRAKAAAPSLGGEARPSPETASHAHGEPTGPLAAAVEEAAAILPLGEALPLLRRAVRLAVPPLRWRKRPPPKLHEAALRAMPLDLSWRRAGMREGGGQEAGTDEGRSEKLREDEGGLDDDVRRAGEAGGSVDIVAPGTSLEQAALDALLAELGAGWKGLHAENR